MQIKKTPLDNSNSNNPWLITTNRNELIEKDGIPLSAEYIWSLQGNDRNDLVKWVFNYYQNKELPIERINENDLISSYQNLIKKDASEVFENGFIKNSNTILLNEIRSVFNEEFYSSKREKAKSINEAFKNPEYFIQVLQNRMGYVSSKEDGTDRPMVFGITDKMIIQGIKSSGKGSIISQFKPLVAKYIYENYCPKNGKVFDYSCGWGARMLASNSLGLEYYGIDPLTSNKCNYILNLIKGKGKIFNGCSEDENLYKEIPKVDLIFSSPPYFNMEVYSNEISQSYNKFKNYNDWLEKYWHKTVKNCKSILKEKGIFGIVMVEKYGNYNLAKDMNQIILNEGMNLIKELPMKTGSSHLTNKKLNGNQKINDVIYLFQ